MGEMADDHMMDDGYSPFSGWERKGRYKTTPDSYYKKKQAKVKTYPEKTFDMGFFPTSIPKPRTVVEPKEEVPDPWAIDGEAPF